MGIANDIISSMKEQEELEYDDVGLPMPDTPNNAYIVARIIAQHNSHMYKVGDTIYYKGKAMSNKIKDNLVILNGKADPLIRGDNCLLIWERLKELTPKYDNTLIKITDGIWWNRKTASVEYLRDKMINDILSSNDNSVYNNQYDTINDNISNDIGGNRNNK